MQALHYSVAREYCMNVYNVNLSSQMSSVGISMPLFHCRWNFIFYMYFTLPSLYLLKVEATLIHLPMSKPNSCMSHHAGLWRCDEGMRIVRAILFNHLNFCLVLSVDLCFCSAVCLFYGCKTGQKLRWMEKIISHFTAHRWDLILKSFKIIPTERNCQISIFSP